MKIKDIPIAKLYAPAEWHRPASKVQDDIMCRSIAEGGIQIDLVVVPDGSGRYIIADGINRVKCCQALGLDKAPCSIEEPDRDESPMECARRLRVLVELRQDLTDTQRADIIKAVKAQMQMNNTEVAHYLGVDPDTITNWLAIDKYIEPVREAVNRKLLTQQAARVFDGMTEYGQARVWKAEAETLANSHGKIHKIIRQKYHPKDFPKYYRNPDVITRRLSSKGPATRMKRKGPTTTPAERQRLATSLSFRESELTHLKDEEKQMRKEINAAAPILTAIRRNEDLWSLVPEEMQDGIEAFLEIY